MKKALLTTLATLFLAIGVHAQTTNKTVSLTWKDTNNPAGTVTYNVYKAVGACSSTSSFTQLTSGLAVMAYDDLNVAPGTYCYYVTAVAPNVESGPSNTAQAVNPFAPSGVTVSVKP